MDRQTGVWRSRLARSVRDAEVGGSSPLTPTRMAHHFLDEMSAIRWVSRMRLKYGMQAYQISQPVFAAGWHLMAADRVSRSERLVGGKRHAVPSSPGHVSHLDPYPHDHRRRWR